MRARSCGIAALLVIVVIMLARDERVRGQGAPSSSSNATLTAVQGIKVGHHTMSGRSTGCTVILAERRRRRWRRCARRRAGHTRDRRCSIR